MRYNNKFIKSLFISGVVFMILMALLSTTQMISGVNQQQAESGSRGASAQNSQTFTEVEKKATQIPPPTVTHINGPRMSNSVKTPAPTRIKKRAMQSVTPTNVAIAGATSGFTNRSYTFDASTTPISTTQPIIYVWQVTDQSTITVTSGLTLSQSFNWSSPGSKTITVTASNVNGTVSTTHHIGINLPPVAPDVLNITGPTNGDPGISHTFSLNVDPANTTLPITITWNVTDHDPVTVTSSTLSHARSFSWNVPGTKTILVTVSNDVGSVSTTYNFTVNGIQIAPSSVSLTGPITGQINSTYPFTATVSPISTTQPITYVWQATDQTGTTHTGGTLADLLSLSWNSIGEKTITVVASNSLGSVSDTHQITILEQEVVPQNVTISGISAGLIDTNYPFTATVSPIFTTQPMTYVWQATDQAGTTHTGATLTDVLSLNWNSIGEKTITVVASNRLGSVSDTHQITILEQEVVPQHVTISGPSAGLIDTNYSFTATVSPISTTQPMTYVWQATDQAGTTHTGATLTDVLSLSWNRIGQKTITVVASNSQGSVSDTHQITISQQEVALQHVTISGISAGLIDTNYSFTATVSPISTTQPITYVWQASDQSDVTQIGGTLTATQSFNWSTPGEKTITVIASNDHGMVTESHLLRINVAPAALAIDGAETGYVNSRIAFTATVSPEITSQPITYTWQSTDHEPRTLLGGTLSDTQFFEWTEPGEKMITITASNDSGTISNSHLIAIEEVAPIAVLIEGPDEGDVESTYNFAATVRRSNTTEPLTYTWQSSEQESIIRSGGTLVDIIPLSWTIEGPQLITVTAANHLGVVSDTHLINIKRPLLGFLMSDNPDPVRVSDTFSYFITVTNNAALTAEEAVLLNELPQDVTFLDAIASQGSCSEFDGDVTCQLGTLLRGEEATITLTMQPKSSGRLTNRANISSSTEELQVDSRTIAEETIVTKPGVGITKVNPNSGFNDVPTLIYIDGFGFTEVLSTTLGDDQSIPLNILYNDPVLIIAEVPAGLEPGKYDLTVTTSSESATARSAYEALDAAQLDDLFSLPEWLGTNPLPMRVGEPNSGISLTVQHLGSTPVTETVTVEFRLDNSQGERLGEVQVINPLQANSTEATELLKWLPEESKRYTIVATIDPQNLIQESNEENNVITRTIFVLPETQDTLPPIVDELVIANNSQSTFAQEVNLNVTANDAKEAAASGIQGIKLLEFEYILGARRWVPVQRSGWVNYNLVQIDYPWKLLPTYGMRYMQAWAVDKKGNISLTPGAKVIDLLPVAQAGSVARNGVTFYRFYLEQGERLSVSLIPTRGDPDLYVWAANGQVWSSNNPTGIETIEFDAPFAATYQIEVHGFSNAEYKLTFAGSAGSAGTRRTQAKGGEAKPVPEEAAVSLDEWPAYIEVDPPILPEPIDNTLYLPLLMR